MRQSEFAETTIFARDNGPICYATPLIQNFGSSAVVQQLLSSKFVTYWDSGRRDLDDTTYFDHELPPERSLTHLTDINHDFLIRDVEDRNEDEFGRWFTIYCLETELKAPDELRAELGKFAHNLVSSLQFVLVQVSDIPTEYLFVAQDPPTAVQSLLTEWDITNKKATVRPYKELRLATLESMFKL